MESAEFQPLNQREIKILKDNHCVAQDWNCIFVKKGFNPENVRNTRFSGNVQIGCLNGIIKFRGGIEKKCGIYDAHIHNCSIGDNVFINHVKNYVGNYNIGNNTIIDNIDKCVVESKSTFGNGVKVKVLDETGGRKVTIYNGLSAHIAFIQAFYRHRVKAIINIEKLIDDYTLQLSSDIGKIGSHSQISNCKEIKNVNIGEFSEVHGASLLENGTINSNKEAPVIIGHDTIAKNFIVSSGSKILEGAIVNNCFVGQGCVLGLQYSAHDSLFFANSKGFHGEATSLFAGPYTVTHHKSTLLIAGMFSFSNAGSGSNQSNHLYKLGPFHHGIVERGSKTSSDSYLLWPAKIGAFTLVMGRHYKNPDTSDMPFSYLIEKQDESWLFPGINLKSVGTIRDVMKWPRRDRRTDPCKLDFVNFNLLSPFTIQKMANGIKHLKNIRQMSGENMEVYAFNNTKIKGSSLQQGLKLYHMGIMKFLGNSIITRLNGELESEDTVRGMLSPISDIGKGNWTDLAGLIAPKTEIDQLLKDIECGFIEELEQIESVFKSLFDNYYESEWNWTFDFIHYYLGKPANELSIGELIDIIEEWKECVVSIDKMLYNDAKKEFRLDAMVGFGIDGDERIKQLDFELVRGKFEENDLVKEILDHAKRKELLGDRVIEQLKQVAAGT